MLKGDTQHPDKVLSLLEPHTDALGKHRQLFGRVLALARHEA